MESAHAPSPTPSVDRTLGAGWDALETRRHIERKDVSAREVIESAIARAEAAAHLGAVFARTYDRALAAHGSTDAPPAGPLGGVPTFVKDLVQIRDVPTTWGSKGAAGSYVSRVTDPIAEALAAVGLVSLGKSACPELGLTATTEPVGFPPCRNPWDPTRTSGGSSGGAATLVAAGVVALAHGSDGGGSIRIPASCCGVVGLKPSRGRLDMKASNLLPVNVACEGVLTRTVRDTVAFFAAIEARRAPRKLPPIGEIEGATARSLRIGVFVDAPIGTPVDPDVKSAVLDAARSCEALGHRVEEIACPFEGAVIDDFLRYWGVVAWLHVWLGRALVHPRFRSAELEAWTRGLARYFGDEKRAAVDATARLRRFGARFDDVMRRYDVLVSPVVSAPAPVLGHLATDVAFETHFERVRSFAPFTAIYNVAGAPAISLPLGRSRAGLPIGVQFGAARGADRVLLELGLSLEAARPWELAAPRGRWVEQRP